MKKDLKAKLLNRKIKKPNFFLMSFVFFLLGIINKFLKVKFKYDYKHKSLKGKPLILLSSHASRLEFYYTLYGFKRKDINMVCGYQNIMHKIIYPAFISLGIISKYLYQPDLGSIKQMLKVLKRNGTLGLFPEGIQSTSGSTHPINPATAQFIKRSKANVVIATSKGAYLATNRYSSDRKKGPIDIEYSLVFTPESLETLSETEIYNILLEKIRYNDFEYNKIARNKYIGKKSNAYGIDKILYKCPDCKEEYSLSVEGDTVSCKKCGFKVQVNEYYDLVNISGKNVPDDIDKWYKWQRNQVRKEITSDDFVMTLQGSLCTIKTDKLRKPPKNREVLSIGTASLTNRGLSFSGILDNQSVDYNFDANSLYSLTFSTKGFLEFYHNNEYYMIIPDNLEKCLIKWTLASEEIHNLYDKRWADACNDVYDYEKGEIYG